MAMSGIALSSTDLLRLHRSRFLLANSAGARLGDARSGFSSFYCDPSKRLHS
jgi:hypothetical protein